MGNISKEIGRGLNIRQIQKRDRKSQQERAKMSLHTLLHGDVNAMTDEDDEENVPFVPTNRSRHRPPMLHSKKNPSERKGKGKGKGKALIVRFYEINSSDSDASSIHEDEKEDVPNFIDDDYLDSVSVTKMVLINDTI